MPLVLKSVDAGRGVRWVGDALKLFARRPLGFTSLFAMFLGVNVVAALLPFVGLLLQLMSLPLLTAAFMVASQSALLDGPVRPTQFIEPLTGDARRRRAMLTLCLVYGLVALAIVILADAISNQALDRYQALLAKGPSAQPELEALLAEPGVTNGMLVFVIGIALLSVPFWHAPALVHWAGQGVGQALFSSTLAVWRNKGAFLLYLLTLGIGSALLGLATGLVLGIVGLPQLAGLLIVPALLVGSTVFYVSLIFTFNDSFGGAPAAPVAEAPGA
jgi:hypothetical protein